MSRKIGPKGLALVKSFEAFIPYPYDDLLPPVKGVYREWKGGPVAGTLTIGYGHTDAASHPLKVRPGLRLTDAEASAILDVDMDECEAAVNRLVKVSLTQGQFDALCSFTFNCGADALRNIAARLNRGDYAAARAALGLYVKAKGRTLAGLVRRRQAEQALWDDPAAPPPAAPEPVQPAPAPQPQAEAKPPAPEPAKPGPPPPSPSFWAGLAAALRRLLP